MSIPAGQLQSIPEALAFWASATPEAAALLAPEREPVTYRELQEAVDCLAAGLRARGLRRQDGIALLFPEGPELCLALLAAIAAGVAVPLAWPNAEAEYRRILASRRVSAVLMSEAIPASALALADRALPIVTFTPGSSGRVGDFRLAGPGWADPAPATTPDPEDIAVILHSSGTTGPPKLVPQLHRALVATARAVVKTRALTAADRCLILARLTYLQGLNHLMIIVSAGATFGSVSALDSATLPTWLKAYRPTYISTTPAVLRILAADQGELRDALRQSPLRCISSAAGPLLAGELRHLEATLGAPILNVYGMSEMSLIAGDSFPALSRVPGAVGTAQCELRIVDEHGGCAGARESGEIVVRGERLFPGYLDDADANVVAFLPGGWFRTGDVGFLDEAGSLHLTGRRGEIINRGGEKIDPREVDDVLRAHPAVAEAAVFAVPDPILGEDIVAAIVLKPGMRLRARELRNWMLDRLSPYKAPRRIWQVASLPRTPTGKVQRAVLARQWGEDHQ